MPELDLDPIEARTNKATPGPWGIGAGESIGLGIENQSAGSFSYDVELAWVSSAGDRDDEAQRTRDRGVPVEVASPEDDAEFIAHARTDVPALVAEVRRLRGILDDQYEDWRGGPA